MLLKLIGQYSVQKYFFIKKIHEIYICTKLKYKDHCIFKQGVEKKLYFFHVKTYLTHIWNKCNLIAKSIFQKLHAHFKTLFLTYFYNLKIEINAQ
jgi:hypothetical protein